MDQVAAGPGNATTEKVEASIVGMVRFGPPIGSLGSSDSRLPGPNRIDAVVEQEALDGYAERLV